MRAGDIVITPGKTGAGPYHGVAALVLPKDVKTDIGIVVWTGHHLLSYERGQLLPHGRVRRVRTYRTAKHNEFCQFRVNFGEEEHTVDVPVTSDMYELADLRKVAFVKALGKQK